MRITIIIAAVGALSACGMTIEEEMTVEEPFHEAVGSWVGANVNEMVVVWGAPNKWQEYESPGDPMRAYWEIKNSSGQRLGVASGGSGRLVRRCEAFVIADEAGTILAAEAKTDRCVEFLGGRLAELHR